MTDLISKKALLKAYGEWLHSDDEVPINALITNAPAISPQQPKEQDELVRKAVADALEEAAKIKVNYTKSGRDDALTKIVEDVIQEAVESAISQYKEAIRAIIKRNAEGGG